MATRCLSFLPRSLSLCMLFFPLFLHVSLVCWSQPSIFFFFCSYHYVYAPLCYITFSFLFLSSLSIIPTLLWTFFFFSATFKYMLPGFYFHPTSWLRSTMWRLFHESRIPLVLFFYPHSLRACSFFQALCSYQKEHQ